MQDPLKDTGQMDDDDDEEETFEDTIINNDDEVIELPAPKLNTKIVSLVLPKKGYINHKRKSHKDDEQLEWVQCGKA